jgi:hypothetical protein
LISYTEAQPEGRAMSIRVGAGLIVLVSFALLTGLWLLVDVADRGPTARNQGTVRDWDEDRLAAVRPLLPTHGVVGFVEKPGTEGANYYLMQYVLAPLVVDQNEPDQELVIGVFPEGSEPPSPPSPRHEVLLEDRDRGIICWKVKGCR